MTASAGPAAYNYVRREYSSGRPVVGERVIGDRVEGTTVERIGGQREVHETVRYVMKE